MTMTFPVLVYLMCAASALVCTGLLIRSYRRTRAALLLWSAIGFVFLSANNIFLVLDLVVFPDIDFLIWRNLSALAAIAVLLYGFIWEAD
jgi:hypothetical protein